MPEPKRTFNNYSWVLYNKEQEESRVPELEKELEKARLEWVGEEGRLLRGGQGKDCHGVAGSYNTKLTELYAQ